MATKIIKNDLANYRKMAEPFQSVEAANAAVKNFYKAIEEARKEFGIMDVHIIVKMNIVRDGTEGSAMTSAHYGNTLEGAPMCAWALGQEQSDYEAIIREYQNNKLFYKEFPNE